MPDIFNEEDDKIVLLEDDDIDILIKNKCYHHIAVIDDDDSVLLTTIFTLKNLEIGGCNLEFHTAKSGKAGYTLIKENPDIKLALIDVIMETNQAGIDLIRKIRKELPDRKIVLIIRSGQPGNCSELALLKDKDVDDYIHKTYATYDLLVSTLKKWLNNHDLNDI